MKKLIYIFLLLSFGSIGQNYIPLGQLGNSTGTTLCFGTRDNKTLGIRVNGTQRFSIDNNGIARQAPVTSSLVLGSGTATPSFWNDSYWGWSSFMTQKGSYDGTHTYHEGKTDSTYWFNSVISRNGNFWDGEWWGSSNRCNLYFFVNKKTIPILGIIHRNYFVSDVVVNPAVSNYTTDANFRINCDGSQPYAMLIDSADVPIFSIDSATNGNVILNRKLVVGTTTTNQPASTFSITGNFGCSTDMSLGTTLTVTTRAAFGATAVVTTSTLQVVGSASITGILYVANEKNTGTALIAGTATVAGNAIQTTTLTDAYIATVLSSTATLNFASTAAGAATDLTMTLTGTVDGDPIIIESVNASVPSNGYFKAWVSASNTVKVRYINPNLVGALDPASGVFKATAIKN